MGKKVWIAHGKMTNQGGKLISNIKIPSKPSNKESPPNFQVKL